MAKGGGGLSTYSVPWASQNYTSQKALGCLSGLGLLGFSQNVPEIAFPPQQAIWEA